MDGTYTILFLMPMKSLTGEKFHTSWLSLTQDQIRKPAAHCAIVRSVIKLV